MKRRGRLFCPHSLTEFVQSCTFNSCVCPVCPFGLETSDRTSDRSKPAKCSSPRRGRNNFFLFISCLAI